VHPAAQRYAEAAECVTDQKGDAGHTEFIDKAFKLQGDLNDTTLATILDEMGVDKDKVMKCLDEEKYKQLVLDESEEGRSFGVNGTPGNLIVDNKTGRYSLVP
jgi:protein-disulfide isomerase